MKKVDIEHNGKTIEVSLGKLLAKRGWYLLHDLGRICGPSIVEASEERFASAVNALFMNSSKEELFAMLEEFAQDILVDGKKLDLSDYGLTAKCMQEFLMFNFEDFFLPLVNAFKATVEEAKTEE